MGQKQSLTDSLHHYIYNRDKDGLAEFLRTHEYALSPVYMDENIYVELISRQWDSNTIERFAKFANDHQLAILIATAVLHTHAVPLSPIFKLMKNREQTIEQYHLKYLFLTICERENKDAVRAFIDNKCYDPSDHRPVRAVIRAQLAKSVVDKEFIMMILEAHPQQTDNVEYLRKNCLSHAKNDEVRKIIDDILFNYIP